jgi:hypothetical protein
MRLGKREKLEHAGLIGVGVEERGLSGGIVVDAGPRDKVVGGGAADRAANRIQPSNSKKRNWWQSPLC